MKNKREFYGLVIASVFFAGLGIFGMWNADVVLGHHLSGDELISGLRLVKSIDTMMIILGGVFLKLAYKEFYDDCDE